MKRIYILLFVMILFSFPVFSQTFDCFSNKSQNSKKDQLRNEDKAQIVKDILLKFDFLNRHINKDEKKAFVYLSTENISSKLIPKILGINFILLNPKEIEEKTKNGFGYFEFQNLRSYKTKILVCFEYNYRDTNFKNRFPGSSGSPNMINGILYEFRKINEKWQGKAINGYESQS